MNKQPLLTGQTRANLLEAFWSLYCERRIDKITVKEIVAKAGYNRGTFYEYFSDVYQCLDHIEQLCLPRLDELPPMPGGLEPIPGGMEHATDFFDTFIKLYETKYKYYHVLLGERGDPAFQRKLIDSIKKAITDSGQFSAGFDALELDFLLEYVLSGMIGIMHYYYHGQQKGTQAEVASMMYRIMSGDMMQRLGSLGGTPK